MIHARIANEYKGIFLLTIMDSYPESEVKDFVYRDTQQEVRNPKKPRRQSRRKDNGPVFFTSSDAPNAIVRNPKSGAVYSNDRVGSVMEDRYFVAKDVSQLYGSTSGKLFYDSPEDYETHTGCTVPTSTKETWFKRHQQFVTTQD